MELAEKMSLPAKTAKLGLYDLYTADECFLTGTGAELIPVTMIDSRVIGSGTMLDTARFRALLARSLGVDARHIHAYVLGEHGDSEVIPWSLVTVGGVPLDVFCEQWDICTDDNVRKLMEERVRGAAYQVIQGKGGTYYGIGSALARIVEVILRDKVRNRILAADLICYPVGIFYSSVIANLLPKGVGDAILALTRPNVYIPNGGTDP